MKKFLIILAAIVVGAVLMLFAPMASANPSPQVTYGSGAGTLTATITGAQTGEACGFGVVGRAASTSGLVGATGSVSLSFPASPGTYTVRAYCDTVNFPQAQITVGGTHQQPGGNGTGKSRTGMEDLSLLEVFLKVLSTIGQ